ncbi:reverse transcriptase domain-containing protein [Tanacetum coccineum]
MSTRSSARRLLFPIEDPKKLISRRNRSEPSLLFDLEEDGMVRQAPPQAPIPELRSMEELLQEPTDGVGDAIVIDTFYNSLSQADQDSLNSAAGGNFLTKNTQEALTIIENKSKVQTSRNKPQVASIPYTIYVKYNVINMQMVLMERPGRGCPSQHHSQPWKKVDQEPETITNPVLTKSTTSVPPPVVQPSPASTKLPHAPVSSSVTPEPNPHQPSILYPSRLNKEKLQGKADIQIHSFLQMFKKIHFNISFAEALAHMPKFAKMVKDLLTNKEKLLELANTPLNENFSAVLLKKLPKKLGDTRRFLIPCDFYRLESCMALADLGASINLMPLSVWKTLSLPDLSTTRMTLELATRTVAYPAGIAEDVFVQVGKFTFPADFVVVDYEVDPRVSLILGRPFLRTTHALVDVHGKKLTLRVGDEELVFNVEKEDTTHNFSRSIRYPPGIDNGIFGLGGDILFLEELLNEDPTLNLLPIPHPICLINETEKIKSSINDPPDLEFKDLPPHLEYAYLEGTSKLPVIIAKDLKREEKEQLLKVLKSHKRVIDWKISDIRGIDPNFCTHKILMEDDFKPAVQH